MSFDLVAMETMIGFDGYEYAATHFNAPGTYEQRRRQKTDTRYVIRDGMNFPFNINTVKGRLDALIFLFDNLPKEIFGIIFQLAVGFYNQNLVYYPSPKYPLEAILLPLPRLMYVEECRAHLATLNKIRGRTREEIRRISRGYCQKCGTYQMTYVSRLKYSSCNPDPRALRGCRHRNCKFVAPIGLPDLLGGLCGRCYGAAMDYAANLTVKF